MNPEVSVIIPAYNCKRTIKEAVDSALCQSVTLEIIIIDDASPEDLTEVLAEYREHPQVRIYRNETNQGVAASRNRGVALARGGYVAFLDADDIWRPDKLEKQLDCMKRTGAVLSSTARELIEEDGTRTGRILPVPETITYRMLLYGNVINCSSVVIKKEAAEAFPMGDDDAHEDYICWLNILKAYGTAVGINEPLLLYRMSRHGKSGSKLHSAKLTYQVYQKMGFGKVRSLAYFAGYAIHGVKKYFLGR